MVPLKSGWHLLLASPFFSPRETCAALRVLLSASLYHPCSLLLLCEERGKLSVRGPLGWRSSLNLLDSSHSWFWIKVPHPLMLLDQGPPLNQRLSGVCWSRICKMGLAPDHPPLQWVSLGLSQEPGWSQINLFSSHLCHLNVELCTGFTSCLFKWNITGSMVLGSNLEI
jgi:hypothetical protein